MKPVKIGYVGCGFMAQKVHIPNLVNLPNGELVAIAEKRPALGARVQARYHIPRLYRDHQELAADPEIEAVAVSAAFHVQGEIAKDLLAAGKHVFMEKPMAISLQQGKAIVQAAQAHGGRLMVGYMKRYDAGNELVREKLIQFRRTGELGAITFVRNHGFCGDWISGLDTPLETTDEPLPQAPPPQPPDWLPATHFDRYVGYLQQYTHNLNLLRWFLEAGDQVGIRHVDLDPDGYTGVVILDLNGTRAVLESGRISHYRWDEHTQIYFEDGWIKTWAPPLLLRNVPAKVEIYRAGDEQVFQHPLPTPRWSWAYRQEMAHFLACLQSGEPFRSSGTDTLTDVKLMEMIYQRHLDQTETI